MGVSQEAETFGGIGKDSRGLSWRLGKELRGGGEARVGEGSQKLKEVTE